MAKKNLGWKIKKKGGAGFKALRKHGKVERKYILPTGRDWKTKWVSGANLKKKGFGSGYHYTGASKIPTLGKQALQKWNARQWQILDFGAYNKSVKFKKALQKRDKNVKLRDIEFKNRQDIADAHDIISGAWQQRQQEEEAKRRQSTAPIKLPVPTPKDPKPLDPEPIITNPEEDSYWKEQMDLAKSEWDTQLGDAKSQWEAQHQTELENLQNQFEENKASMDNTYQSRINELNQTWGSATQDLRDEISDLGEMYEDSETTIGELEDARAAQDEEIKKYQEESILNAERARIAASYGRQGRPVNRTVKGVRTQIESKSHRPKFSSSFFGRSGSRLKSKSLNIA